MSGDEKGVDPVKRGTVKSSIITAKIQRFDPRTDKFLRDQGYRVESNENMSVLGLVKHIHDKIDRSLAYRNVGCYLGSG